MAGSSSQANDQEAKKSSQADYPEVKAKLFFFVVRNAGITEIEKTLSIPGSVVMTLKCWNCSVD